MKSEAKKPVEAGEVILVTKENCISLVGRKVRVLDGIQDAKSTNADPEGDSVGAKNGGETECENEGQKVTEEGKAAEEETAVNPKAKDAKADMQGDLKGGEAEPPLEKEKENDEMKGSEPEAKVESKPKKKSQEEKIQNKSTEEETKTTEMPKKEEEVIIRLEENKGQKVDEDKTKDSKVKDVAQNAKDDDKQSSSKGGAEPLKKDTSKEAKSDQPGSKLESTPKETVQDGRKDFKEETKTKTGASNKNEEKSTSKDAKKQALLPGENDGKKANETEETEKETEDLKMRPQQEVGGSKKEVKVPERTKHKENKETPKSNVQKKVAGEPQEEKPPTPDALKIKNQELTEKSEETASAPSKSENDIDGSVKPENKILSNEAKEKVAETPGKDKKEKIVKTTQSGAETEKTDAAAGSAIAKEPKKDTDNKKESVTEPASDLGQSVPSEENAKGSSIFVLEKEESGTKAVEKAKEGTAPPSAEDAKFKANSKEGVRFSVDAEGGKEKAASAEEAKASKNPEEKAKEKCPDDKVAPLSPSASTPTGSEIATERKGEKKSEKVVADEKPEPAKRVRSHFKYCQVQGKATTFQFELATS